MPCAEDFPPTLVRIIVVRRPALTTKELAGTRCLAFE
jgi:hypothetical protein